MQTGLMSFELIAKLNRLSIDLRAVAREYSLNEEEMSKEELVRIIKNHDFKVKIKQLSIEELNAKYPVPAILILKDNTFATLLKINLEKQAMLVFMPEKNTTVEITYEKLQEISTGEVLILAYKKLNEQVVFGFKWFYFEIIKYKKAISEVLVGSFMVQIFGLISPLFTQVIIDKVIVHRSISTLDVLAFAFIATAIFELLLNFSRRYIFIHTTSKIDAKLGAKLFKHLFSLPYVYFENRKVGNIIVRIRELDTIREFITNKSITVIIDLIFSFVFVIVMFLYSGLLSTVVLVFVALIAILYLTITPELRARLQHRFEMGAHSNSYLVESVTGIQTVKSIAIEGSMQKKWEDYLAEYIKSGFKLANTSNIANVLSGFIQKTMTITILYIGVRQVLENQMTIGQLIAFQMFAGQFTGPVLRLVGLWNEFQQAILAVDRIGDILNHPIESHSDKAITLPSIKGSVKFDKICFKYAIDAPYAVQNVSFEVPAGLSVGIVGRSGSGKSTITKLLQRLYLPNEGAIYVDDIDIRHMNPFWYRNNIGVVLQENYLFSGTIRDNISLPRQDSSIERIIEVAKTAGVHDFISQLPEGYDTMVGERGSTLSGGQKQRVAIARALITDPKILIFDEATSALDYESEKIILDNLDNIKKGRTTFFVAHRLSTIRNCDAIIVFEKGQIAEVGTHQQLMAAKKYYYFLNSQQEVGSAK